MEPWPKVDVLPYNLLQDKKEKNMIYAKYVIHHISNRILDLRITRLQVQLYGMSGVLKTGTLSSSSDFWEKSEQVVTRNTR